MDVSATVADTHSLSASKKHEHNLRQTLRNTNKIIDLLIVVAAVLVIPEIAIILTDCFNSTINSLDTDETFLWISTHHLIQLFSTVALMFLLSKKLDLKQWGFNLNNLNTSMKWIGIFLVAFTIIEYFRIQGQLPIEFAYPITEKNKTGIQFFQYILSGLGEEPLFRGLVMVFLAKNWNNVFKISKLEIPITIAIATILFMVAHLQIDYLNLNISGFDFDQQMKSMQLGILYGLAFHYTKSLLAPIVIHGLSNGIQFSLMYILMN